MVILLSACLVQDLDDKSGTDDSASAFDQDADGYTAEDGDCDDKNAGVHPGAVDTCDGVDQDCDGEAVPEGSCGGVVDLGANALGAWVAEYQGLPLLVDEASVDYSGDGSADVVAFSVYGTQGGREFTNGAMTLLTGVPVGSEQVSAIDAWTFVAGDQTLLNDHGSGGDIDGDGATDLVLASQGCKDDLGALYVVPGPVTALAPGSYLLDEAAAWSWEQAEAGDCFGYTFWSGGDADGDGFDDLLTVGGGVRLLHGGPDLATGMQTTDSPWLENVWTGLAMFPDLDGDGLAEVAYEWTEQSGEGDFSFHMGYLPIDAFDQGAGERPDEVAEEVALDSLEQVSFLDRPADIGDLSGDGYTDAMVVVVRESADGRTTCAGFLEGSAGVRSTGLDETVRRGVCSEPDLDYGTAFPQPVADIDGDGANDLAISGDTSTMSPERDGVGCLIGTSLVPSAGWEVVADLRPFCFGFTPSRNDEGRPFSADLDGDGYAELIGSQISDPADDQSADQINVAAGFAIPFGDDTRW